MSIKEIIEVKKRFEGYIGVFDSGVGGISVLKELTRVLPHENFIFYGDSKNAPYGEKSVDEVLKLVRKIAKYLVSQGVKAIVVACNTATSVAISDLRATYPNIPIIGMEPAIKLAAMKEPHHNILVMATPITLKLDKYQQLSNKLQEISKFIPVACTGLAKRIEQGNLEAPDFYQLLNNLLSSHHGKIDCIVLGCTHYLFIKKQIRKVLGDLPFYDGNLGTVMELKRRLEINDLLTANTTKGIVEFESSKEDKEELELYKWFFDQEI